MKRLLLSLVLVRRYEFHTRMNVMAKGDVGWRGKKKKKAEWNGTRTGVQEEDEWDKGGIRNRIQRLFLSQENDLTYSRSLCLARSKIVLSVDTFWELSCVRQENCNNVRRITLNRPEQGTGGKYFSFTNLVSYKLVLSEPDMSFLKSLSVTAHWSCRSMLILRSIASLRRSRDNLLASSWNMNQQISCKFEFSMHASYLLVREKWTSK